MMKRQSVTQAQKEDTIAFKREIESSICINYLVACNLIRMFSKANHSLWVSGYKEQTGICIFCAFLLSAAAHFKINSFSIINFSE